MRNEERICDEILELDRSIRFVGIANKMGKLVPAKFNRGVKALLMREEIEANIIKAVLRMRQAGESHLHFCIIRESKESFYRFEQGRLFTSDGFI